MTEAHLKISVGSQDVDILLTVTDRPHPDGDRVTLYDTPEGALSVNLEWIAALLQVSVPVIQQASHAAGS